MARANPERWTTVYPVYLNANKKLSEGRRVPLASCCPNPTVQEIAQICEALQLEHVVEKEKRHPGDQYNFGRVKVALKNEAGEPFNATAPSKTAFIKYAGSMIPKLKSRVNPSSSSSGGSSGKKTKKKGKKKKKKRG